MRMSTEETSAASTPHFRMIACGWFVFAHLIRALESRDRAASGQASFVDRADQARLATERLVDRLH
jgi:hypothetical protein